MTIKQNFLNYEIWILTFGGAFQRANVYKDNTSEKARTTFRKALMEYVEKEILPQYKIQVSEKKHLENIARIIKFSKQHKDKLNEGLLRYGFAQKLLNLFLKYHWCLGNIQTPPHFPVDRLIQEKMKFKPIINWTTMEKHSDYLRIINHARNLAGKSKSIAEWELVNFKRN